MLFSSKTLALFSFCMHQIAQSGRPTCAVYKKLLVFGRFSTLHGPANTELQTRLVLFCFVLPNLFCFIPACAQWHTNRPACIHYDRHFSFHPSCTHRVHTGKSEPSVYITGFYLIAIINVATTTRQTSNPCLFQTLSFSCHADLKGVHDTLVSDTRENTVVPSTDCDDNANKIKLTPVLLYSQLLTVSSWLPTGRSFGG